MLNHTDIAVTFKVFTAKKLMLSMCSPSKSPSYPAVWGKPNAYMQIAWIRAWKKLLLRFIANEARFQQLRCHLRIDENFLAT